VLRQLQKRGGGNARAARSWRALSRRSTESSIAEAASQSTIEESRCHPQDHSLHVLLLRAGPLLLLQPVLLPPLLPSCFRRQAAHTQLAAS
jgi:hypothetical protein